MVIAEMSSFDAVPSFAPNRLRISGEAHSVTRSRYGFRSLTVYRLTFGQPRQDDLLDYLQTLTRADIGTAQLSDLQIRLSREFSIIQRDSSVNASLNNNSPLKPWFAAAFAGVASDRGRAPALGISKRCKTGVSRSAPMMECSYTEQPAIRPNFDGSLPSSEIVCREGTANGNCKRFLCDPPASKRLQVFWSRQSACR